MARVKTTEGCLKKNNPVSLSCHRQCSTHNSTKQFSTGAFILRHGLQVEGAEDGGVLNLRREGSRAAAGLPRATRAPAAAVAPARGQLPRLRLHRGQLGRRLLLTPTGVGSILYCTATLNTTFIETLGIWFFILTHPSPLFLCNPFNRL